MNDELKTITEAVKDPTSYGLLTYLWVIGLSVLGGVVNFARKVKQGFARPFNLVELLGEIFTAAFAGVITFYLCEAAELNPLLTAAFVGICGHMGSRALFLFEKMVANKFGVGPVEPPKE